jgi:CDP-paratose 2-epimerase
MDDIAGRAFNIGGGPQNAISLLELIDTIAAIHGERPSHSMRPWRLGDQRYYVTDPSNFRAATGWTPTVRAQRGVELLYQWLVANRVKSSPSVPHIRRQDEIRASESPMVLRG